MYQSYIDSLKNSFEVSNTRIINGTYSTNWDGEKRLSCKLKDTSCTSNILISYSTTIINKEIIYPVSFIIADYKQLYALVENSSFFREYLYENKERELTIVYDDNSCFTDKLKRFALDDCKLTGTVIDFENAVFISLKNEFGNISRWALLPNGQYFMWWNDGSPPIPIDDKNYLKCE